MARKDNGTVTVLRHGKEHVGSWAITGKLITVSHPTLGVKSTQIGGLAAVPESLARIMLGELISQSQPRRQ
jgi:hypothetical protein